MGKAYSDDLRRKVLETCEQGEGTLEDLAKRFCVSLSWTKKILAAYSLSGKMERPTGAKRGRKSKVTPEIDGFLQAVVATQADLTLAELKERLFQEKKLEISIGWLWSNVKRLGLRFKKTLHASEQASESVQKMRAEFRASINRESGAMGAAQPGNVCRTAHRAVGAL